MPDQDRQRVDKWLFFARIAKSRSLAARMVQGGQVRLNRVKIEDAAQKVKPQDVLTIALERRVIVLRVLFPGTRRGPAPEARMLYEDLTPAPEEKAGGAAKAIPPLRDQGAGRPTKKDRRALDRWREED